MRRTFNENTAIPLAKAVVTRSYGATFGNGLSQLGRQEELYYDPVQQFFVFRRKGDLLSPFHNQFFPCFKAQSRTILLQLPGVNRKHQVHRFLHQGKPCLISIEEEFRLRISIWYYHLSKAVGFQLSSQLTSSLLDTARQPGRQERIKQKLAS